MLPWQQEAGGSFNPEGFQAETTPCSRDSTLQPRGLRVGWGSRPAGACGEAEGVPSPHSTHQAPEDSDRGARGPGSQGLPVWSSPHRAVSSKQRLSGGHCWTSVTGSSVASYDSLRSAPDRSRQGSRNGKKVGGGRRSVSTSLPGAVGQAGPWRCSSPAKEEAFVYPTLPAQAPQE